MPLLSHRCSVNPAHIFRKTTPFKEKPQNPLLCLLALFRGSCACIEATSETTRGLSHKYRPPLNGAGHGWSRWLNGHTALALIHALHVKYSAQGLTESHMSGIWMGEIGFKWVTYDSLCLSPDSCNRPSSYWTNMIRLRTERVFKAFPIWNLWRKPTNKEILRGI